MKHIPAHWVGVNVKKVREYIWSVFATLQPYFVKQVVNHADSLRYAELKNPD